MSVERAVLVIADIGGYTRFMRSQSWALAHAQDAVARLLEAVLDEAGFLKLAKLEGDAAFLYAIDRDGARASELGERLAAIRAGFLRARSRLLADMDCTCQGCTELAGLRLKFVAHAGEVGFQRVKQFTELAGVDVILVHRMLKNDVPVPEYLLMTPPVLERLDERIRQVARELEHELEGIGKTLTHYVDLAELVVAVPEQEKSPAIRRLWERAKLTFRSLPYVLGLKKPCEDFRNVEIAPRELPRSTGSPS